MENKELKILYYYVEVNDMSLFFTNAEQDKAIAATEKLEVSYARRCNWR